MTCAWMRPSEINGKEMAAWIEYQNSLDEDDSEAEVSSTRQGHRGSQAVKQESLFVEENSEIAREDANDVAQALCEGWRADELPGLDFMMP